MGLTKKVLKNELFEGIIDHWEQSKNNQKIVKELKKLLKNCVILELCRIMRYN